jgi:hypothetical protein
VCLTKATGIDDAERATHTDAIRRAMREAVRDAKSVDVSVSKLSVTVADDKVLVTAEIKVVVSNEGQIRSLGSGSATFAIAKRTYRPERARELRSQALQDALEAVQRRLRASRPVA